MPDKVSAEDWRGPEGFVRLLCVRGFQFAVDGSVWRVLRAAGMVLVGHPTGSKKWERLVATNVNGIRRIICFTCNIPRS